jgi:hypothetical protein
MVDRQLVARYAFVIWLAVGSTLSAYLFAMRFGPEIWLGMLAPLVVTGTSWMVAEHWYRRSPERLTSVMTAAFAAKLVFFGVYVGLLIGTLDVRPVPFAVSFAAYYIVLHMIEALWLKRLFVS